ncbi:hypothetical protein BDN70DRAFT_887850 [Pholiota conissans]|uniref:Uncharacterized protein n=1 Tax=Pholiota conissans TaxID=109636 RepID=A0A9P6CTJ7_9AGAR|nr:hypothetical protein BDN70DRAFT_887850 [Pholiota conissans]
MFTNSLRQPYITSKPIFPLGKGCLVSNSMLITGVSSVRRNNIRGVTAVRNT